jgi:hypothetical protein
VVLRHRQQAVGIGGSRPAPRRGSCCRHQVDEARVLVGEAVVVLPPDGGGRSADFRDEIGSPPGACMVADIQPLGVLVEHRIDHMGKGFVGVEEAMRPVSR